VRYSVGRSRRARLSSPRAGMPRSQRRPRGCARSEKVSRTTLPMYCSSVSANAICCLFGTLRGECRKVSLRPTTLGGLAVQRLLEYAPLFRHARANRHSKGPSRLRAALPPTMAAPFLVDSILFTAPAVSDLQLPAKHYTPSSGPRTGYTLLLAHASGMHKEQWEPALHVLLAHPRVRDAWALEWPSHGAGASVNAAALNARGVSMCASTRAQHGAVVEM
jgi:hypothetical protein